MGINRYVLCTIFALTVCTSDRLVSQTLKDIQDLRQQRIERLSTVYTGTRGDLQRIADSTILSEEAIKATARKAHLSVTKEEAEAFLIPMLTKQGLVDPAEPISFTESGNLNKWLTAQGWTVDQLLKSSETLLLWIKLAVRDTPISTNELKEYALKNPDVYRVPARVQLNLTVFQRPRNSKPLPKGLAVSESLSPTVPLTSRSAVSTSLKPEAIPDLQLFLDLNRIDPELRRQLEGKAPGDHFGPLSLQDGTIIAGTVVAIKGSIDLSTSPTFWQYCAILARLSKSNQQQQFEEMTKAYVSGLTDPAVRGLFGDILGVVGTGVGALFGGVGAPVGGALGGMVGSWIDSQNASPSGGMAPPPPQFQGFPQAQPFQQAGFPQNFPSPFQGFTPPQFMPMIPPMPQNYGGGLPSWGGMPPFMPWGPPMFFPMPMRMF